MNSEHLKGMESELKAAQYFVKQGCELYWPMAAQSRCDFLAVDGGNISKVQVKTITYMKNGPYTYKQCRLSSSNEYSAKFYKKEDFHVIVFVGKDCMYVVPFEEVQGKTSVNFGNDNPSYKPRGSHDLRQYLVEEQCK